MTVALGDFARQHRAGRAVDVGDRKLGLDGLLGFERRLGEFDQLVVEHLLEAVVLRARSCRSRRPSAGVRLVEQLGEVEAARLPVFDGAILVEYVGLADHLAEGAEAELRHESRALLRRRRRSS